MKAQRAYFTYFIIHSRNVYRMPDLDEAIVLTSMQVSARKKKKRVHLGTGAPQHIQKSIGRFLSQGHTPIPSLVHPRTRSLGIYCQCHPPRLPGSQDIYIPQKGALLCLDTPYLSFSTQWGVISKQLFLTPHSNPIICPCCALPRPSSL